MNNLESRPVELGSSYFRKIAKLIVEDSFLGIILVDKNLNIVATNARFSEIVGYEVNQLVAQPFLDIVDSEANALIEECISGQHEHCVFQQYCLHKGGQLVPVEISLILDKELASDSNFDLEQDTGFAVITVEDISQQRDTELKLRAHFDEIKLLEREKILSEVVSEIAHQINQPLTAISSYAQSCLNMMEQPDKFDIEKMRAGLEKLRSQVLRAGSVTEKFRTFARSRPAKNESCDCNSLVDIAKKLILTNISKGDLVVRSELSPDLPAVNCDPIHVLLVIVCLMRNAMDSIKSTAQKNNEIRLSTGQLGNGDIYISVSDSGSGVHSVIEEELFMPFASTRINSIGMGLTVSQSIADSQGGKLSYINNASGGATFSLILSSDCLASDP